MNYIITVAYIAVLVSAVFVILRWRNVPCTGSTPTGAFTFIALLFTAGMDMGLVMLPLTEYPTYAAEEPYKFTNPLAIEFGFWGPLVWMMYFLSAFYFVVLEPHLKVFENPIVKWVYNLTIIATCAFTAYLFSTALPTYIPGITTPAIWGLIVFVLGLSVYSSGNVNFMKWLAVSSTWMFVSLVVVALVMGCYVFTNVGLTGLVANLGLAGDYFLNLHRFVTPITDYHSFYLFWWFSWSIMIGQFVATFCGGLKTWKLAVAMIVAPSIPIVVWFSVLFLYFQNQVVIPTWLNWFMITVGIIFVCNSLDSLIRLYALNLDWTKPQLGSAAYYPLHFLLQLALVAAYSFTPFKIEWVGTVVIGIYALVYAVIFMRTHHVRTATAIQPAPSVAPAG